MDWDIQDVACHFAVISKGEIDVFTGSCDFTEKFFHLLRPNLHE